MTLQTTLTLTDDTFENGVEAKDVARILQNRDIRQWIMRAPYSSIDSEQYDLFPEYQEGEGNLSGIDELSLRVTYMGAEILTLLVYLTGKRIWDISKQRALIDLEFDVEETVLNLTDSFSFEAKMHNDSSYEPDPSFELCRELAFYINEYLDEAESSLSDVGFTD